MDSTDLETNDKDAYNVMISKLKMQKTLRQVYLMLSYLSIPVKYA